ncbi:acyl-CoA dehydrogenase family protein [Actinokineospora xionganensis]|uniref:Acyl-CoA/acyl-ACP dehydrogenase n=1 Tax=Actinokineospora xionganensis TaxID=2684470 RepID=A0ABR7L7H1_9PSEU|nr:acyl-CoA dehydrogenase family protein [Actinokineospora xionganensis]MBC6448267.1 acyl-CoA/acyl-ACP dehydrogenase [Actinokineospora xionganensis]
MRFALTAEQRQFAASLDDLLSAASVPSAARAWAAGDPAPGLAIWRELADLGVMALAVPERFGGLDATSVDLVVAFEQLGRHAVPGPLVESVAVAPTLADESLLPDLARGKVIATVALPPHVPHALDADIADLILTPPLSTPTRPCPQPSAPPSPTPPTPDRLAKGRPPGEGRGLLGGRLRDVGAPMSSVDGVRRLFRVDAPVVEHPGFEVGVLAVSAQLVGLGQAMVERAVEYAKTRTQFGGPIGRFQAVKHLLADALVGVELARPLVYGAAVTMSRRDISAAKVAAGGAADRAARAALQVHGAVGYTQEYDLGLWLTKARALRSAWGTPSTHRERVLDSLTASRSR